MKKEREKAREKKYSRKKTIAQYHENIRNAIDRKSRKQFRNKLKKFLGKK